jgi:hypothetical protein
LFTASVRNGTGGLRVDYDDSDDKIAKKVLRT